jgi:hypothetical protein
VRSEDVHEMGRIAAALDLHDEFGRSGFRPPARRPAGPQPASPRRRRRAARSR